MGAVRFVVVDRYGDVVHGPGSLEAARAFWRRHADTDIRAVDDTTRIKLGELYERRRKRRELG